jgi:hypothetical protein
MLSAQQWFRAPAQHPGCFGGRDIAKLKFPSNCHQAWPGKASLDAGSSDLGMYAFGALVEARSRRTTGPVPDRSVAQRCCALPE